VQTRLRSHGVAGCASPMLHDEIAAGTISSSRCWCRCPVRSIHAAHGPFRRRTVAVTGCLPPRTSRHLLWTALACCCHRRLPEALICPWFASTAGSPAMSVKMLLAKAKATAAAVALSDGWQRLALSLGLGISTSRCGRSSLRRYSLCTATVILVNHLEV